MKSIGFASLLFCLFIHHVCSSDTKYTAKLTNLTSKYVIEENVFESERCSLSHIPNSEFYLAFWTNYDSKYRNIKSGLYQNNGELLLSLDNEIDPTDGYNAVYSYGIRTSKCPLMKNNISITAITFYRKINDESHSKVYLKLLFSYYNDTTSSSSSSSSSSNSKSNSDTMEIFKNNNNLNDLLYEWNDDLIEISGEMINSSDDGSHAFPDIACIEHGLNDDGSMESVGLMVAWEHYSDSYFHNIFARYLMINYTNNTANLDTSNNNNNVKFLNDNFILTMGNSFIVSNYSNNNTMQKDMNPYISGQYIDNNNNNNKLSSNDSITRSINNIIEEFLITRTIENEKGYDIVSTVFNIDSTITNATGYVPRRANDDFSIARFSNNSNYYHNYIPISQGGELSTCCWNQIGLSIGGYISFYTYFDSMHEQNYLYLSYIYNNNNTFDVNKAILIASTGNYGYYGEIIELFDDYNTSNNNENETNIFVLYGDYNEDTQVSSVLGKLYHISKKNNNNNVVFTLIDIDTGNGNNATNSNNGNNSTMTEEITFASANHYYYYKCASSNYRGNDNIKNKSESDIMMAWTDWGYDMYGKFVNLEIESHKIENNSNNPNYYSTTNGNLPHTSNGFYTTQAKKSKPQPDNNDELDDTSIVLIVVVCSLSLMCITCVCVFGWLVHKGKINIQIGGQNHSATERLLNQSVNGNAVQLTSEEIERNRNFSAVM